MTSEQLLYAGIAAVSAALLALWGVVGVLGKILWDKNVECEADRKALRAADAVRQVDIVALTARANLMQGQIDAMKACPSDKCPMRRVNPVDLKSLQP